MRRLDVGDPAVDAKVFALLAAANPRRSAEPGDDHVRGWWGPVRAETTSAGLTTGSELVAVGAWSEHVPGVPHLESVATLPADRGRGLGAAVTAAMTRRALAAAGWCTLGMYADNDVARRLYHRLGYHTHHRFISRSVLASRGACGRGDVAFHG